MLLQTRECVSGYYSYNRLMQAPYAARQNQLSPSLSVSLESSRNGQSKVDSIKILRIVGFSLR